MFNLCFIRALNRHFPFDCLSATGVGFLRFSSCSVNLQVHLLARGDFSLATSADREFFLIGAKRQLWPYQIKMKTGAKNRASLRGFKISVDGQGGIDLVDGGVQMIDDFFLVFDRGGGEHIGNQTSGFAKFVVGQDLFFAVPGITGKVQSEQFGGVFHLVHGPRAMAMVIMIARGQNVIGAVQHAGFGAVAEGDGFKQALTGISARQWLRGWRRDGV